MKYRIRYGLYVIEAHSAFDAKQKALKILKEHASTFVSVEPYQSNRPLWKKLLLGP